MRQWVLPILGILGGCAFDGSSGSLPEPDARVDAPPMVDAMPDTPMVDCPAGYEAVLGAPMGSRYKRLAHAKPLAAHAAICAADGTHVVTIESPMESLAMQGFAPKRNGYFWLGITDAATEGQWLAPGGQVATYLPWYPTQPNGGFAQNCALQADGSWFDFQCDVSYPTVCECD